MDPLPLWGLALGLAATGLFAGLLAGLLGVGGGIVLVPVLDFVLHEAGFPAAWCMHVAVATSLATVVPTAISSSRAHHRRGAIDWSLARAWAPGMIAGGLLGSLLAARAQDVTLAAVFGVIAGVVAIKMFLPLDHLKFRESVPRGLFGNLLAAGIGTVSAMIGIGGGSLSVPAMTLLGGSIHSAVGTAAFFGLLLAVPGTVGYLLANPGEPLPGATVGLVSFAAFAIVAPLSMITAPIGARLAHALDRRTLAQIFGFFLCIVAVRMIYRTLT